MDHEFDAFRAQTQMISVSELAPNSELTARDAFEVALPALRTELDADSPIRYAIAAVSSTGAVHTALMTGVSGQPAHLIGGRHDRCDLHLTGDPSVSLRHVLLWADIDPSSNQRIKVLDLGTTSGVRDEQGARVEGLASDGDLLVQVGSWWLVALLAGQDRHWPVDASEAWEALPSRICGAPNVDDKPPPAPPRRRRRLEVVQVGRRVTQLRALSRTAQLGDINREVADAIGALMVGGDGNAPMIRVSPRQLAAGLLVGRYDRCALTADGDRHSTAVSRVHLCLLLAEGGLWAMDTCSTNGTTCDGENLVEPVRLGRRATLELGGKLSLLWQMV